MEIKFKHLCEYDDNKIINLLTYSNNVYVADDTAYYIVSMNEIHVILDGNVSYVKTLLNALDTTTTNITKVYIYSSELPNYIK